MRCAAAILTVAILAAGSPLMPCAYAADGTMLVANKKKSKKKKKFEDDGFGMDGVDAIEDNDSGVGIHREQEGVDTPYVAEVAGATQISLLTTKIDQQSSEATTFSSDGHICFRFGKFFLGPEISLSYSNSSTKATDATTGRSGSDTYQSVSASLGPLMRFYFANVDRALTIPFVYSGAGYVVETTTSKFAGANSSSKSSDKGFEFKVGAGMTLMMDSNIGLAPKGEFYSKSLSRKPTSDAEKESKISTSGVRLLLELMTFL